MAAVFEIHDRRLKNAISFLEHSIIVCFKLNEIRMTRIAIPGDPGSGDHWCLVAPCVNPHSNGERLLRLIGSG